MLIAIDFDDTLTADGELWRAFIESAIEKVKKALDEAVSAIYFADSSDYLSSLWTVVSLLGGDEAVDLLERDGRAAFEKYCGTKDMQWGEQASAVQAEIERNEK